MQEQKSSWCFLARLCATRCFCSCVRHPRFALHLQLSGSFHLCCLVLSQHNKNRKQLEEQWLKQESQQLAAHDFLS